MEENNISDEKEEYLRYGNKHYTNSNKAFDSEHIDKTIAKSIFDFLAGKKDTLPSIDSIINYYKRCDNSILSMGYGLIFSKRLEVTHSEPLEHNVERLDIFGPGTLKIIIKGNVYDYYDDNIRPLFDTKRISILMGYLKLCKEKLELEEEKEI